MTNLESISVPLNRPIAKCTDRKMDFALLNRSRLRATSIFVPFRPSPHCRRRWTVRRFTPVVALRLDRRSRSPPPYNSHDAQPGATLQDKHYLFGLERLINSPTTTQPAFLIPFSSDHTPRGFRSPPSLPRPSGQTMYFQNGLSAARDTKTNVLY